MEISTISKDTALRRELGHLIREKLVSAYGDIRLACVERFFRLGTKKAECIRQVNEIVKEGDVVLVKGSRGMKMEDIVKEIMEQQE